MNERRSSPILPIAGKWNGAEMRSGTTLRAPPAASASVTRRMPSSSPAIVTWFGPLSFATTTRPSSETVRRIVASTSAALMPTMAAIEPCAPRVAARWPRIATRRSASENGSTPATTRAENSPSECPATNEGRICSGSASTPRGSLPSVTRRPIFWFTDSTIASKSATLVVRIAGCATVVSLSFSAGPSKQIFVSG